MLRGLATISLWASDMAEARAWYSELLGAEPYFQRPLGIEPPAYVEWRVGDYQHEIGLVDRAYAPPDAPAEPGGTVAYWHVDDVAASFERLLSMGATVHQPPIDREAGFVTASVVDPFGNILGLMYNPHYLEMLDGHPAA